MTAADFGGWATKADLKCADGLTIGQDAFKHQNGEMVALLWGHRHDDPEMNLGHAILEQKDGSTYAHCFFNEGPKAQATKTMLKHDSEHGKTSSLSIWANRLKKRGNTVLHGVIREVSVVLAGANPGAKIEFVNLSHGVWDDDFDENDDVEAVIHTGLVIDFPDDAPIGVDGEEIEHAEGKTAEDVLQSMTEEQRELYYFSVNEALKMKVDEAAHSDLDADDETATGGDDTDETIEHTEGTEDMTSSTRTIFEGNGSTTDGGADTLQHGDLGLNAGRFTSHVATRQQQNELIQTLRRGGSAGESLKHLAQEWAGNQDELQHGIENMTLLFPDAKSVDNDPQLLKRRTEWVADWLGGTTHRPFSRIKTLYADITEDEARALGHIKGNLKKEEFFKFAKRVTTATMVYKKQRLDREDILEITDFDIVVFMKGEMRLMLDEEVARAGLIGDGRDPASEDKIKDPGGDVAEGAGIRSIVNDHELYAIKAYVNPGAVGAKYSTAVVDPIVLAMGAYKGSGSPTLYTSRPKITSVLLERDGDGKRLYRNRADLAEEMGVAKIVDVEVMESVAGLFGIIVNPKDYVYGTNRGGDVTLFDDFDLNYNQGIWLIETFLSGALHVLKSAIVIMEQADGDDVLVAPAKPAFDAETGELTITDQAGVVYKHGVTVLNNAGSPYDVPAGTTWTVDATPAAGYYFASSENDSWNFKAEEA